MQERWKRFGKALLPVAVVGALALALYLLYGSLRSIHYRDVMARLGSYAPGTILAACLATAINYAVLTLYDVLALRYVGKSLPYGRVAMTSFLSYVFSNNIGLSLFGSSALRLRFYPLWGVETGTVARIVGFCVTTFWIGLAAMGGAALVIAPPALAHSSRLLGILLLGGIAVYLGASASGRAELRVRRFSIKLPNIRIAIAQTLVSSLDWSFAALVLYLLLPAGKPPFISFISIFMLAQLAGSTSHVPGGLGVFESVIVLSLSSYLPADVLLGSLLAYRGIYFLAPLALAIVVFVGRETWAARNKVASAAKGAARVLSPFVPFALAAAVFLSGALLIFSGATPAIPERRRALDLLIPLTVLEASHFTASLVGLALLVIADALRRRVDAAYYLTLGLLASGIVTSLLKGLKWEEALILGMVFLLLLPSHQFFKRRAAILARPLGAWRLFAIGTVLATTVWIGLFAYKHVQYSSELWWVFEFTRDAPRSLRAIFGVMVAAAAIALWILLSPVPTVRGETLETRGEDVRRILAASRSPYANLALLGDKFFHFSPSSRSFIMYGVSGKTFVAMGDPVGEEEEFRDLIWDFYELVRGRGGRVVWYEISAVYLPVYVELGLRFYKIGEEATVELGSFTMEGGRAKRLRPPYNKLEREGYSFRVLSREELPSRLPDLRSISDAWLAAKNSKEKGFSLGFFDEGYLENFPCAIIEKEGQIVAFSNLWSSGDGKELAIDLMRHRAEVPNGTMEFLFIGLMLWAKAAGYERFDLGMAPLSGVESREAAPLWNKAVNLLFKNGEGIYNFQGLRSFKEKFGPTWAPRFIIASGGASLPVAAADIVLMVSRGRRSADA